MTKKLLYFWVCGNKLAYDFFESHDNSTVTVALLAIGVCCMSKCGELQGAMKVDRKIQYVITFLLDPVQSQLMLYLQQLLHHCPNKAAWASFCSNLVFSAVV